MTDELFEQLSGPTDEPPATLFGMPLFYDEDEELGVPLEGVAIIKSMVNGEIQYRIVSTKHVTTVECIGMLRWAQVIVEDGMLMLSDEEEDAEDGD